MEGSHVSLKRFLKNRNGDLLYTESYYALVCECQKYVSETEDDVSAPGPARERKGQEHLAE